MHLAYPHKGWENEHLATFLLSRVAFVASPLTIGDDLGTDLFCTLFEQSMHNDQPVLLPRSSIAVQVKSKRSPINIASKLEYIARLEVPYYLGVVDQKALTLELFSARFLPALLSMKGKHSTLHLCPVDSFDRHYRPTDDSGAYSLLCHKVATLSATDDEPSTLRAAAAIRDDSSAALTAIASRLNKEYVFEIPGGEIEVYAGRDSAKTFRHAFYKRLAEAYFNLSWLLGANQPASDAEMDAFVAIADDLLRAGPVPEYVLRLRDGLQERRREAGQVPQQSVSLPAT
jgi:hypothetical protein